MPSIFPGCPVDAADPAVTVAGVPGDRLCDSVLPGDARLPAGLAVQLLVAHAKGHHLARTGSVPLRRGQDLASLPVALLAADAQDQVGPVTHRDVLPLAVDVEVARDPACRDHEASAH